MSVKMIKVRVSAGAKTEKIEEISPNFFKIRVREAPEKGRANKRVAELLAEYLKAPLSEVILVSGNSHRQKVFLVG